MSPSVIWARRTGSAPERAEASLHDPGLYLPFLDGLRAISITLVVLAHFGLGRQIPGLFGVTIFFFISGYLITRQLLGELESTGRIAIPRFYLRRILRLYPALLAMIVAGSCLFVAGGGVVTLADLLAALFYFANLRDIGGGFASLPGVVHPFAILWSLAVEEHFYLVFPLLTMVLGRPRRRFRRFLLLACLAVTVWRVYLAASCCHGLYRIEHGTDTRADAIVYGAVLATLERGTIVRLTGSPLTFAAAIGLLVASLLIRNPWFRAVWRFSVQDLALLLCVGGLLVAPRLAWLRAALSAGAMVRIGQWSYSLYLWHWLVLMAAGMILPETVIRPILDETVLGSTALVSTAPGSNTSVSRAALAWLPVLIAVSLVLAAGSYRFIEQPFRMMRRRFGSCGPNAAGGHAAKVIPKSCCTASSNGAL